MRSVAVAFFAALLLAVVSSYDRPVEIMGVDVPRPDSTVASVGSIASSSRPSAACHFVYGMVMTAKQWQDCLDSKEDRKTWSPSGSVTVTYVDGAGGGR